MFRNRLTLSLIALLAMLSLSLVAGCGSGQSAGDADSTGTVAVDGSMETDADNVGQRDSQQPSGDEDAEDDESASKREKATSVGVVDVFRGSLVLPVVAEGTLRARHTAEIHAEVGGKVSKVHAQEGQRVRRGTLLVKLDSREYEAAIEESRARYLQALSLLSIEGEDLKVSPEEYASSIRDEFTDLDKQERQGKITREERIAREIQLDIEAIQEGRFRYEVAAARSGVSEARASMERARLSYERSEIRAPFDGVLTGLTLNDGELVAANEVICTLVDDVNIEAEIGVLEADLGHVIVGKPALLEVPALGETFPVTVDVVSPQFNRESRTCQVLLRVRNESGRLRPGMFVRAQVAGQTFTDRLLVPREAVLTRDGRPLLFKVEDDRAKWLYIQVGAANDYMVEVERVLQGGGLAPGDAIIVTDHLTLAHDAKVKVKKARLNEDPWITSAGASE